MSQDIRLKYFFLPLLLRVQPKPDGEEVVVLRPSFLGTFEFIRLPIQVAHQLADLLDLAADNAAATPVVDGNLGEINGTSVRKLGTAKMRIQLSVKRSGSIQLRVQQIIRKYGTSNHRSTPTISVPEARRFASLLREASGV